MSRTSSPARAARTARARRDRREERLDRLFRALGDQTRRALLARLAREPAMITELAEPFALSLPAVSRHVRVLEQARLVKRRVDGRVHRCTIDAAPLREVDQWLGHYREFWNGALDA
ncbi:MAG: ArsR/SmtB family transcription factor, partial [Gemmatimonadales bacterium]